jgi:hypothetical protein
MYACEEEKDVLNSVASSHLKLLRLKVCDLWDPGAWISIDTTCVHHL